MGKCKPDYKNLNLIQSFSEQRYVTVQLLEQICMNEEWLRQQVEKLKYLSSPAVRKWFRFSENSLDLTKSWGCKVSNEGEVIFDNDTSKIIDIDFSNDTMHLVDELKSTSNGVVFESFVDIHGNTKRRAILKHEEVKSTNFDTALRNANGKVNSYWYVGFDKNETYQTRPDWVNNWKDLEIPAVARAQTVKIKPGCSGWLEAVALDIQTTGATNTNWGSPLYVQIWPTEEKEVEVTKWDSKTKKSVKVYENDGVTVKKETIHFPSGNPYTALATGVYQPSRTEPGFISIPLDTPVKVEPGEHYAIVVTSPLSHYDHAPRIGGWGRNCNKDKYSDGDAFLSEHNCRQWKRYGKSGESQEYKFGKWTPQDFSFELKISDYEDEYTDEVCYLYLNPIHANPIKSVTITAADDGDTTSSDNDLFVEYEISVDGRTWEKMENKRKTFTNSNPKIIFIRAKMWQTTSNNQNSPTIENMSITLVTDVATEFYARSVVEDAKINPMLGASRWGRVYAPFFCEDNVNCSVEIIKMSEKTQHIYIADNETLYSVLQSYVDDKELESGNDSELNIIDFNVISDSSNVYQYLVDNPDVVTLLNKLNIYVKPYTDDGGIVHPFGWYYYDDLGELHGNVKFNLSPAYPILESIMDPMNGEKFPLGEWFDYTVDYDNDTILFDMDLISELPTGTVSFTYNPIFVQDLTLSEIGDHVDSVTGLSEQGLIMDYFKQDFTISASEIQSRTLPLKVVPVEPLREVIIIHEDETEEEVYEGKDFTVDYNNHEIIFKVTDIDGISSVLSEGDKVSVVYIPNFEETSICIGYRAKRTDSKNQVHIKDYYLEYKV